MKTTKQRSLTKGSQIKNIACGASLSNEAKVTRKLDVVVVDTPRKRASKILSRDYGLLIKIGFVLLFRASANGACKMLDWPCAVTQFDVVFIVLILIAVRSPRFSELLTLLIAQTFGRTSRRNKL